MTKGLLLTIIVLLSLSLGMVNAQAVDPVPGNTCTVIGNTPICTPAQERPAPVQLGKNYTKPPKPIMEVLRLDYWMEIIGTIWVAAHVQEVSVWIGTIIALVGVVMYIGQVTLNGEAHQFFGIVLRAVFAALILGTALDTRCRSTTQICSVPDIFRVMWHAGYKYSATMIQPMQEKAAKEMDKVAQALPGLQAQLSIMNRGSASSQSDASTSSANGQTAQPKSNNEFIVEAIGWINGILYIFISGTYQMLVMSSIILIVLGKLMFPIAAGALMLPGSMGINMITAWLKRMLSGAIIGLVSPITFALVGFFAILIPLTELNNYADFINQASEYQVQQTIEAMKNADIFTKGVEITKLLLFSNFNPITAIINMVGGLIVGVFAAITGVGIGIAILRNTEKYVGAFFEGIVFGYDNPVGRVLQTAMQVGRMTAGAFGGSAAMAGAGGAGGGGGALASGGAGGLPIGGGAAPALSSGTGGMMMFNMAGAAGSSPMAVAASSGGGSFPAGITAGAGGGGATPAATAGMGGGAGGPAGAVTSASTGTASSGVAPGALSSGAPSTAVATQANAPSGGTSIAESHGGLPAGVAGSATSPGLGSSAVGAVAASGGQPSTPAAQSSPGQAMQGVAPTPESGARLPASPPAGGDAPRGGLESKDSKPKTD